MTCGFFVLYFKVLWNKDLTQTGKAQLGRLNKTDTGAGMLRTSQSQLKKFEKICSQDTLGRATTVPNSINSHMKSSSLLICISVSLLDKHSLGSNPPNPSPHHGNCKFQIQEGLLQMQEPQQTRVLRTSPQPQITRPLIRRNSSGSTRLAGSKKNLRHTSNSNSGE